MGMSKTFFFQNHTNPVSGSGPIFPHPCGVAFCNSECFFAAPLAGSTPIYSEPAPGANVDKLRAWIDRVFGDASPRESEYVPGTVYKRIYRPPIYGSFARAVDEGKRSQSFVALRILLDKLALVFQTIEPTSVNQTAYGHLVRELLLLACMEVEASWCAVLRESAYPVTRLKTQDYVKLLAPMRLDGYCLSLRFHADFPEFSPFDGWSSLAPTQSLVWYDAYNKTKHDRETNLSQASLVNAVHAVGAAVVMFYAQFGYDVQPAPGEQPTLLIRNTFDLKTNFVNYKEDIYIPEFTGGQSSSPTLSFNWHPVAYPF
jgi:hypothetical protein